MTDEVELPCALIPVHGRQLLVPGVSVAEVVRMQRIRPVKGLPDWHLGLLPWRGLVLPVLSVERVLADVGETIPGPRANNALLVMNRTRTLPGLGFYAVLVRGLPRMLWVTAEDLEDVDGPLAAGEASRVRVGQDDVTLKYLDRRGDGRYGLRAHNPAYPTLEVGGDDLEIEGVYRGLLRGSLLDLLTDAD